MLVGTWNHYPLYVKEHVKNVLLFLGEICHYTNNVGKFVDRVGQLFKLLSFMKRGGGDLILVYISDKTMIVYIYV